MIFHCAEELEVGQVYTPPWIKVEGVLMPGQPVLIVRKATAEEYGVQHPGEYQKSKLYPGGHFYEVSTD